MDTAYIARVWVDFGYFSRPEEKSEMVDAFGLCLFLPYVINRRRPSFLRIRRKHLRGFCKFLQIWDFLQNQCNCLMCHPLTIGNLVLRPTGQRRGPVRSVTAVGIFFRFSTESITASIAASRSSHGEKLSKLDNSKISLICASCNERSWTIFKTDSGS